MLFFTFFSFISREFSLKIFSNKSFKCTFYIHISFCMTINWCGRFIFILKISFLIEKTKWKFSFTGSCVRNTLGIGLPCCLDFLWRGEIKFVFVTIVVGNVRRFWGVFFRGRIWSTSVWEKKRRKMNECFVKIYQLTLLCSHINNT